MRVFKYGIGLHVKQCVAGNW